MARADFEDKKFVFAGVCMIVDENEGATAYLTHESLLEVLEKACDGKKQASANGTTDIVILADLDREDGFIDTVKGQGILKQCENEKRKTEIELVRFEESVRPRPVAAGALQRRTHRTVTRPPPPSLPTAPPSFMKWSGLESECRKMASMAVFAKDDKKYEAPGSGRTRGRIFPRTLVAGGDEKGSVKGLYNQYFK